MHYKKVIALLLSVSMMTVSYSGNVSASETGEGVLASGNVSVEGDMAQETIPDPVPVLGSEAPEPLQTEAPAPVTEAPATEAPATEAAITEAPVTETSAPETETPAAETGSGTETQTEAIQEPMTEAKTEKTPAQSEGVISSETDVIIKETEITDNTEKETIKISDNTITESETGESGKPVESATEASSELHSETLPETESEGIIWTEIESETEIEFETESETEIGFEDELMEDELVLVTETTVPGFLVDPSKYPPANITENTNKIYWFLRREMGLNHAAACGFLGNIQMESNFSPLALASDYGSYGICQWTFGRLTSLVSCCRNNGLDYNTVDGQLAYLKHELETLLPGVYSYLLNVPDTKQGAYDAGYYICAHFEVPADTVNRSMQRGNLAANEYFGRTFELPAGMDEDSFIEKTIRTVSERVSEKQESLAEADLFGQNLEILSIETETEETSEQQTETEAETKPETEPETEPESETAAEAETPTEESEPEPELESEKETEEFHPVEADVKTDLYVREEPDPDSEKILTLHQDETVTIISPPAENDFVEISVKRDGDEKEGYVNIVFLDLHEEMADWVKNTEEEKESESGTEETESAETSGEASGNLQESSSGRGIIPCFFGDSRVVGMSRTAGYYNYIGKVAAGYDWMCSEGMSYLESQLAQHPDQDIVFCFGVNDLPKAGSYISAYQNFMESHPDANVWFMAVNPVIEGAAAENGYHISNTSIEQFNEALRAAFPTRFIDTYSYLLANGYSAGDGLHYTGETYNDIQNYAIAFIQTNKF